MTSEGDAEGQQPRRLKVPAMIAVHTAPTINETTRIVPFAMNGSLRKSLKPMAPNSLSSTATQNTGSEKRRN